MRLIFAILFIVTTAASAAAQERQPDGSGDPKATSCMTGEEPTGSHILHRICYTNAQWAELKRDYIVIGLDGRPMLSLDAPPGTQIIGPDGKPLVSANDPRNIHSRICVREYTGGAGSNMKPNFNTICDNDH